VEQVGSTDIFLIEGFRFDRAGGCLLRTSGPGAADPVALGSRALALLGLLVERQDQLVTKEEIFRVVWSGMAVEEANLTVQISALRRILDRDRQHGSCIQTVPGRGYRFVAPVIRGEAATTASISDFDDGPDRSTIAGERPEPLSERGSSGGPPSTPTPRAPHRLGRAAIAIIVGTLCLVAAVAAVSWRSLSPGRDVSAPRLSIVVLPFTSLGSDPDQQPLADALTEDLTIGMSRIANMFVISSGTAFTYRNKPVDAKRIGHELGVRYVLEGSVQLSTDRVRVNVQLIDAGTDGHLWVDRFDRNRADLLALRDEITGRIAYRVSEELATAAASHPTDQPDALDYILQGRAALNIRPTSDGYAEAIRQFEQALALDPHSVEARSRLALVLVNRALRYQTETTAADISRARELVEQVLDASPDSALAHLVKGRIFRAEFRYEEAIPEFETVISLNPNSPSAYADLGWCKFLTGSTDEVVPLLEKTIGRLGPNDPFIHTLYVRIGLVHLVQSHIAEAIDAFEKARNTSEQETAALHAFLAAAYALQGDSERAATELAEVRRLDADGRYSSIARLRAIPYFKSPNIESLYEAAFFSGLRKAGVPEE
jgi:TolB-like protein/DNA-binding winged helix-turn-helix (wHTH) protein/cytochrome c-type biogenesis protein CcmH/NrfG